ncbi:MAG TPA: hypothetical protein VFI03_12790 [Solirubrobacterales bacterium]|nr:hypothetical protein [Solirubrobacterales bacterium]
MRSTTFALLGVTAAMALGLVAVASQQDWPLLPAAPIPGFPGSGEVEDATVVAVGPAVSAASLDRAVAGHADAPGAKPDAQARSVETDSQLSDSRTLDSPPPQSEPDSAADAPTGEGSPTAPSPSQPPSSAPAPSAAPAPSPASASPAPATPSTPAPVLGAAEDQGSDKAKEYVKDKSPGGWKGGKPSKSAFGSKGSRPEKSPSKPEKSPSKSEKDANSGYVAPPPAAAPVVPPVVKPDDSGYDDKDDKDDSSNYYADDRGKDHGHSHEHGK